MATYCPISIEVGLFIADQLGLDLPAVAKKLNDPKNKDWLVNRVGINKVEGGVKTGQTKRRAVSCGDHSH